MTLKEQQQQAERRSYELRVSDVPLQRNPLNGRFLKGHTPANKGKKWSEYLSKRKQKRCAKGWENLKKHRVKGGPGRPKKPVIAVNETGKWLYLSSCKEAGRLIGVRSENILRCCNQNLIGTKDRKGNINCDHKYMGLRYYFESDPKWIDKTNQK